MPAIQPARLKQQAALLAEQYQNPAAFLRGLHHLLDFYADRSHRPGQAGKPRPLTQAYKVGPPVIRQIFQELVPLASMNIPAALELCDQLWQQPFLEFRLLAVMLLGQIPVDHPEPVLQRVNTWLTVDLEEHLTQAVLNHGLIYLQQAHLPAVMQFIQEWLDRPNIFNQQLGLKALLPMIRNPEIENLPTCFRLVHPLVRVAPAGLRSDLLDVLASFAQRSPQETAFYLRQTLALPNSPDTPWLVRQSLHAFPKEIQDSLRKAARGPEPVARQTESARRGRGQPGG
ncbi:MAG: DNA alkylation repair protein [Anaerolineales bacterium]|nr:DNA alkylation repair protein [Anaerolineales bacterium]